ncbi:MAG TPA: POTRA domain-containing protein [Silvibacterium sp.]|nr:POTRA domain-containing protein [Silvibacterium sp.]
MAARLVRLLLPFFCCLLLSPALVAQKYTIEKVSFTGYPAATQAELMTAAGLQSGVPLDQPEIQAAAQKLSDTGLFSDVHFAFDGSELKFTLTPADGAVPALFVNFPWWDNKTLTAVVSARVPLFHGTVIPESGMQRQVTAALTALVTAKGVPAKVTAQPHTDSAKLLGIDFQIESPPVQIVEVKFLGASGAFANAVDAIQMAAAGQAFNEATQAALQSALCAVYHRDGYLEVKMTKFAHGEPQFAGGRIGVPVSATIVEGPQYRVGNLTLSGDALMTQEEFAKLAKLHAGDVANEDLLHATLAEIAAPYKTRGYLQASIEANPTFDRTAHFDRAGNTVSYSIVVVPGPVFHMGKLTLVNLDDDRKALVLKYWTMHEGDVYDATYPPAFLNMNRSNLRALEGWSANYMRSEHEDTHVVDVTITFQRG